MTLSPAEQNKVSVPITRPIFVVEIHHGGVELLSTAGSVIMAGRTFSPGVALKSIADAQSASLELPFTTDRVAEIQSGSWRGGACKIWAVIARTVDPDGTEYPSGHLRLDGRIQSSRLSGDRIQVTAVHRLSGVRVSPRHTYSAVCTRIPSAGTVIVWEGDNLTLESRR